jgi:hypothetical protein
LLVKAHDISVDMLALLHRCQFWDGNQPTWPHTEVNRRTVDVGIFLNTAVMLHLVRMLLADQDEDTVVADQNQAAGKPRIR